MILTAWGYFRQWMSCITITVLSYLYYCLYVHFLRQWQKLINIISNSEKSQHVCLLVLHHKFCVKFVLGELKTLFLDYAYNFSQTFVKEQILILCKNKASQARWLQPVWTMKVYKWAYKPPLNRIRCKSQNLPWRYWLWHFGHLVHVWLPCMSFLLDQNPSPRRNPSNCLLLDRGSHSLFFNIVRLKKENKMMGKNGPELKSQKEVGRPRETFLNKTDR